MPIRKSDYPPNWPELSLQVRAEANWKCEQCGVHSGAIIRRGKDKEYTEVWSVDETDPERPGYTINVATYDLKPKRLKWHGLVKIVLTVSHTDRNSKNSDRSNLRCLCQRCHLVWDKHQRTTSRKNGRYWKDDQLHLPL